MKDNKSIIVNTRKEFLKLLSFWVVVTEMPAEIDFLARKWTGIGLRVIPSDHGPHAVLENENPGTETTKRLSPAFPITLQVILKP